LAALNLVKAEINSMINIIDNMLETILLPFFGKEAPKDLLYKQINVIEALKVREEKINFLEHEVAEFLLKVGKQELSNNQTKQVHSYLSVVNNIERISDILYKEIHYLIEKQKETNCEFSEEGKTELIAYHTKVCKQISRLKMFFETKDYSKAETIIEKGEEYALLEDQITANHLNRMNGNDKTVKTHRVHMELIDCFKRIELHLENIARNLLRIKD
jgi:phosphate:Na+ symporter